MALITDDPQDDFTTTTLEGLSRQRADLAEAGSSMLPPPLEFRLQRTGTSYEVLIYNPTTRRSLSLGTV